MSRKSYDEWHVFGLKHLTQDAPESTSLHGITRTNSTATSPRLGPRPFLKHQRTNSIGTTTNDLGSTKSDGEKTYVPVVARVSSHALRIEREYHLCRSFIQTSDPECSHTALLLDLKRLPSRQDDEQALIVSIFESPGRNYMKDLQDFGPTWLKTAQLSGQSSTLSEHHFDAESKLSISTFLAFGIGACECLELLHHGSRIIHGELRSDAFHYNQDTTVVKMINFGSGPRSFEHGLTSSGWMTLSRETGIKNKLQYIAPEQTGRMPAEPNSRTDIYGLGVLLWTMLTGKPAFQGETPLDVREVENFFC